jgi:hypothetical protein
MTSSTEIFFSLDAAQDSGLWQYKHRNGQPCKKITKRTPGPSTAPNVSILKYGARIDIPNYTYISDASVSCNVGLMQYFVLVKSDN